MVPEFWTIHDTNLNSPTSAHYLEYYYWVAFAVPLINLLIIKFVKRHTFSMEHITDEIPNITKATFVTVHFSIC